MDNSSDLIKIIIADDHAIFRAGIIKVLNLDSQFQIIGEATNGLDAISLINTLSPDVALLDIKMPVKTGIEIVRELIHKFNMHKNGLLFADIERNEISDLGMKLWLNR